MNLRLVCTTLATSFLVSCAQDNNSIESRLAGIEDSIRFLALQTESHIALDDRISLLEEKSNTAKVKKPNSENLVAASKALIQDEKYSFGLNSVFSGSLQKKFTSGKQKPQANDSSIKIGDSLGHTKFLGANGLVTDLNDYKGKNVLLVIMRGFPGNVCIACANQTAVLAKHKPQFKEKNTEVFIVYPGAIDTVSKFLSSIDEVDDEFNLNLPVLYDINMTAVKEFKISGELAKPTSILLDKNGKISYVYVGKHKTDRPSVQELLKVIK